MVDTPPVPVPADSPGPSRSDPDVADAGSLSSEPDVSLIPPESGSLPSEPDVASALQQPDVLPGEPEVADAAPLPDVLPGEPEVADAAPLPAVLAGEPEVAGAPGPPLTARTRVSGTWVGVIIAAVVLTLLIVFIRQNTRSVKISYFTAHGTMPLGVALLLAAIGGLLLAAVIGSLRIWQLRHRLTGSEEAGGHGQRTRHRSRRPKAV
jgi:uncharacterized integral membrane protein